MTIEPDHKSWTWVLERRCPECGFEAKSFDCREVAAALREKTSRWRSVLSRETVRERPRPDRWSPLEYACHVRDVFRRYDQRLDLMMAEGDAEFPNWNQNETAIKDRYREQDPAAVADELEIAGEKLAANLDRVHGEAWQRTGRRSDGAVFTIDTFARYLLHDPVHHLWDVGE